MSIATHDLRRLDHLLRDLRHMEARAAGDYDRAALERGGEFAVLNFPVHG